MLPVHTHLHRPPCRTSRLPHCPRCVSLALFFFNDPATTEIYTLSLHDALPIYLDVCGDAAATRAGDHLVDLHAHRRRPFGLDRSEEHTSELQSPMYLVCRLLLEKKKKAKIGVRSTNRQTM